MTFDLYATDHCPRGVRCEACGTELGLLQPWAVRLVHGVLCMTMCPTCTNSIARLGVTPPLAATTAEKLIDQHAGHLQISRHDMALVLTEEDRVAAVQGDSLSADYVAAVVNGRRPDGGHGVRPAWHEHVECSVCGGTMVHVDVWTDGSRRYAAHPMVADQPESANCSNTDHRVGTHRGRRPAAR